MSAMTRLVKIVHLVLFVLLFAGCEADEQSAQQTSAEASADEFLELPALLDAAQNRPPGVDTLAVLDRLPPPRVVETETRRNRHDSTQTDTLRTYIYEDLTFTVYEVSKSGTEILQEIRVTGPDYETTSGLRVGLSREEVRSLRGRPDDRTNGNFVYRLSDIVSNTLTVHFEQDAVSAMEWDFYVD